MSQASYDIQSLSSITEIPVRTIRFYVAERLLPPPDGRGPMANYGAPHLLRLQLIRRLQEAHLPLAEIRTRLAAMSDEQVARALHESIPADDDSTYVQNVLRAAAEPDSVPPVPPSEIHSERLERSSWDRIVLHPSIELHVRRPLPRSLQRKLDSILDDLRHTLSRSTVNLQLEEE